MNSIETRIAELQRENLIADIQVYVVIAVMLAAFALVVLSIKP